MTANGYISGRWPAVGQLQDGDPVEAATFNRPLSDLMERTEFLRREVMARGGKQSVTVDAEFSGAVSTGTVVSMDLSTGRYSPALASMSADDPFTASDDAFALGVATYVRPDGRSGSVCLYGFADLSGIGQSDAALLFESGEGFSTGMCYLSSFDRGRLTARPKGPRIAVGTVFGVPGSTAGIVVNPQHAGVGSHAHRTYRLAARPAGQAVESDGVVSVLGMPASGATSETCHRLHVSGHWASDGDASKASYHVEYTPASGSAGASLSWTAGGIDAGSGTATLSRPFEPVAVGSFGVEVMVDDCGSGDAASWDFSGSAGSGWSEAGLPGTFSSVSGTPSVVVKGVPDDGQAWRMADTIHIHRAGTLYRISLDMSEGFARVSAMGKTVSVADASHLAGEEADESVDVAVPLASTEWESLALALSSVDWDDDGDRPSFAFSKSSGEFVLSVPEGSAVSVENGSATAVSPQSGSQLFLAAYGDGWSVGGSQAYYSAAPSAWTDLGNGLEVLALDGFGDTVVPMRSLPPAGAAFRYSIGFDMALSAGYPPVPASSASLMLNGVELEQVASFGGRSLYEIGPDTVYWRDRSVGNCPWAPDGRDEFRLLLHMVTGFLSETGPVTSIRPAPGSPITVRRCGTDDDSSVGDLELGMDMSLSAADVGMAGGTVAKGVVDGRLLMGPVVEKVVAGPGISLSDKSGQGVVTISADGVEYSGDFDTVSLENAKVDSIGMFPYLRLLRWEPGGSGNVESGFVAKFHVPATAAGAVYRLRFYATVFGETGFSGEDGTLSAGIRLDYNILPDCYPVPGSSAGTANLRGSLIAPDGPLVLNVPLGSESDGKWSYSAFDPVLVHNDRSLDGDAVCRSGLVLDHAIPYPSDCSSYIASHSIPEGTPFGIRPGYTVALRFSRCSPTSGRPYTGAVGILNLRWSLVEVVSADTATKSDVDSLVERTVLGLRRAAASSRQPLSRTYDIVEVLSRLLGALK